jgi:hypothetical protein
MAYNNFLVKIGLYGIPLDWSYDDYGNLATKAMWFHNLWILVQRFNVVLMLCAKDRVQGLRGKIALSSRSSFVWVIAARILFCLTPCISLKSSPPLGYIEMWWCHLG